MGYISLAEELVKHKIFLIVMGAVLFLLGALGGFAKAGLNFVSPGWGVAVSVIGAILLAVGLFSFLKPDLSLNAKGQPRMKIDGQYHTRDTHHYQIHIIPLPKDSSRKDNPEVDYYRIHHADWEGVGFFDNECFYTVFQINDKATPPERRGNWGAHVAKWRSGKKKWFEVYGIELKEKNYYEQYKERELKEKQYGDQLKAGELTEKDYYDRLKELELKENDDYDQLQGDWIWEKEL